MKELLMVLALFDEFKADAQAYRVDLPSDSIVFVITDELPDSVQAKADWIFDHWVISFDSSTLEYYTKGQIKFLVYHELGHVLLRRNDTFVFSIMNPEYSFRDLYKERNKILVRELFLPDEYHERKFN